MPRVPLALQSYRHPTLPLSAQRALNVYAEAQPQDAKSRTALLLTPGLVQHGVAGAGPIRGIRYFRDALITVSGGEVWRVARDGSAEVIGAAPGTGFVRMATDGRWLVLTDIESAETRLLNVNTLETITDPDFTGAKDVAVAGGYFVFLRPEGETAAGQWFISALRDPVNYDALDFASAEARPDAAMALAVLGLDVWIFGQNTIEIWVNTGRNSFPFERAPGGVIERGTAATASVQTMRGIAYWLGDDRVVYRASSSTPQRISTHAQEQAWARLASVADAESWAYQAGGHGFYGMTLGGTTWVFDDATNLWHERQSRGLSRWRGRHVETAWEQIFVGDAVNGTVWRLDPVARTDGADMIEREAITPPLHGEGARMVMSRVTLDVDAGQGLLVGQGADPQAMLSWSDDGGRTWGNELWRGLGQQGKYRHRADWRRLGQFRERCLRVRMTDAVGTAFLAAEYDAIPGGV